MGLKTQEKIINIEKQKGGCDRSIFCNNFGMKFVWLACNLHVRQKFLISFLMF